MSRKHLNMLVLLSGLVIFFSPGMGRCQSNEEIFLWTIRQMHLDSRESEPPIRWVQRDELKSVFVRNNSKAYLRWEDEYGADGAQQLLRTYLDEIVGLFDATSGVVYVGDFLGPCRRQAILAHEFTHFLQQRTRGPISGSGDEAGIQYFAREMEAYRIEELFTQTFCPASGLQAAATPQP